MALACLAAHRLARAATITATARSGSRRVLVLCRSATSKAAKEADLAELYRYERCPCQAPIFPELLQPGRRAVLLAVDPDIGGAVAAISWLNPPAPTAAAEEAATPNLEQGIGVALGAECGVGGAISAPSNGASTSTTTPACSARVSVTAYPHCQQPALRLPPLDQVAVELHDMPVEVWKYGTRDKRQPDAGGLIHILQRYAEMAAGTGAFGLGFKGAGSCGSWSSWRMHEGAEQEDKEAVGRGSGVATRKRRRSKKVKEAAEAAEVEAEVVATAAITATPAVEAACGVGGIDDPISSSGSSSGSEAGLTSSSEVSGCEQAVTAGVAAEQQPPIVRAVVEYTMPLYASGKYAWFGVGFAVGLLNGLLASHGIPYHRVPSSTWKRAMGLKRQGKDASIALARHLLPTAAIFLKRKKDHGRAEALLMAAWGLGIRMHPIANDSGSTSPGSTDEETNEEVLADDHEEEAVSTA